MHFALFINHTHGDTLNCHWPAVNNKLDIKPHNVQNLHLHNTAKIFKQKHCEINQQLISNLETEN